MSSGFEVINLGMRYGKAQVLSEVTLRLDFSQLTALAGPNGAGKSTLLGILSRLRRDFSGECKYRGQPIAKWRPDAFAREVAYVPQSLRSEFPFSAELSYRFKGLRWGFHLLNALLKRVMLIAVAFSSL